MKTLSFSSAQFLCSALADKVFPEWRDSQGKLLTEIALVGRSNVGKSSLINHLLGRKKLAKVSATPGKTQTINFFSVDDDALILVDLPGYGYAQSAKALQQMWAEHLDRYLRTRSCLTTLLILLDVRRTPSPQDLELITWATHNKRKILLVFTKCDTLKVHEKEKNIATNIQILKPYIANMRYVEYSIKDPQSKKRLIHELNS